MVARKISINRCESNCAIGVDGMTATSTRDGYNSEGYINSTVTYLPVASDSYGKIS